MESKLTIRLPKDLHDKVREKAKREDITLSQVLRRYLRMWLEKDPPEPSQESE